MLYGYLMKEITNLLSFKDVPALPDIESITDREKYQSSLYFMPEHETRDFVEIIAPYHLKGPKIKCGISSCGTPHLHGYLISTSDGLETNIGKDCGFSHFEAVFSDERKRHDELYEMRLKVSRIIELKEEAPKLLAELSQMKSDYNALKSLRYKLRGGLSSAENQLLENKVKSSDYNLYRYESLSKNEREAYFETNPSARKTGRVPQRQIKTGEIFGMNFLAATYADEDIFNFIPPLQSVISSSSEDIYTWRKGEISKTHAWIGKARVQMDKALNLIESGNKFFTRTNIMALEEINLSGDSLEKIIRDISFERSFVRRNLN